MPGIESPEREDFDDGKARVETRVWCQEAFHHGGTETQRKILELFLNYFCFLRVSVPPW
jgi:hypothetical protein